MAKKTNLPRLTSVRKLTEYALLGEHARAWYTDARPALQSKADSWGVTLAEYCDVLALTSPRVSVRRNVHLTDAYFYKHPYAELQGVIPSVTAALAHWESTGEIRGPKTRAFSKALQGDGDAIVLDVWMARAFGIDQVLFGRKSVREECEKRVRKAARKLGWTPAEVQAAVWTAWYETLGRKGETNVVRIADLLANG